MKISTALARQLGLEAAPRRPRKRAKQTAAPCVFASLCVAAGLYEPVAEFCFAPPRKWRFDWAWPECMTALEIEGGIWTGGRHTRGAGFVGDMEKYNAAAIAGWKVLRCTPEQMEDGSVFALLKRAMP